MGIYFMIHSIVLVQLIFLTHFAFAVLVDSIGQSQSLSDGKTLVSPKGTFEFGFFSPGDSKSRYLGIWYAKIPVKTVVWVANRCNPINDTSGLITLNGTGNNLVLLNRITNSVIWSTNSSPKPALKPILQLLESGNLVLRDEKSIESGDDYLWQSFDFPSDTLLPGMKFGWDLRKGLNREISAWKNRDDPCPADFDSRFEVNLETYPEVYIRKNGSKYYRAGPWNGLGTSGYPAKINENPIFDLDFVVNKDEAYYTFNLKNESVITILVMNMTTITRQRLRWIIGEQSWSLYSSEPKDHCDNYGLCGGNSICTMSEGQLCKCLDGFEPKYPDKWHVTDWSGGCVKRSPPKCEEKNEDAFFKMVGFKIPDTANSWGNRSMTLKECRAKCLNNCSCVAFSNSDIRGQGSGCIIWFGDLIDIREFPSTTSQDLYIRVPASELSDGKIRAVIIVVPVTVIFGTLLVGFDIYKSYLRGRGSNKREKINNEDSVENSELPLFSLSTIILATANFSSRKKLGQGGYGPVYKGQLEDGHEIAVKRLCINSGQGLDEFKNEVILIAKLQHRNLVKLLGCCIEEEEKLLVYEYMPNKSLDSFIFEDEERRKRVKWPNRYEIICGVARGILYLHQDSRLRIIHRDLKASNILLDKEMNPKISDFGLARTFRGDQTEGNTNRVVGTFGYMAPEYAFNGSFSTKSDVFSFGIMVLEIISGKRSRGFQPQEGGNTLTGHAWSYMKGGKAFELVDTCLRDSIDNIGEVLRCIHIGLLCVQQRASDRPDMSSVVVMLGSESTLPEPKLPGFYMETDFVGDAFSSRPKPSCTNEITFSLVDAR